MTEARQFDAVQRWFLGLAAGGFIIGGLILAFASDPGSDELAWGGILLRSGMISGAWWLVLPEARRVGPTTWHRSHRGSSAGGSTQADPRGPAGCDLGGVR
ncbi:MAG: hypothetical protein IH941_06340 [Acidobacteria bacterium]|nr:hypothetical protein [Acidobacteriota bacterium]